MKKSVIKYIPYFFYTLSVLGTVLGILYPDEIPMLWVVMVPYVIGIFLQTSADKNSGKTKKTLKILAAIIGMLILVCAVVAMSLFLR